jgi:uncharacterized damage-inducible protein DinB
MTYYGAEHLAKSFKGVRDNTIRVAQDIPETHYGHPAAEGARTVAQMLVHTALSPRLFWQAVHESRSTDISGFDFFGAMRALQREEATPRTKAEILELLATEGAAFTAFLAGLSEEDLAATVTGPTGAGTVQRSRFEMLLGAKEHEMHHRAQLMLVERQLGVVPHLTRQMQQMLAQFAKDDAAGRG